MHLKTLVKLSNIVALISIVALIYWVFCFISINVFGFKVFRENITETFALSVFGIIALMAGSLMINVMSNLTRIAERHNQDVASELGGISKKIGLAFLLSFPLLFGLLYAGDYLTSKKKESLLIASAKQIVENHRDKSDKLLDYRFDENWLLQTDDTLDLLSKSDGNFRNMNVIVQDSIDGAPVFLAFRDYARPTNGEVTLEKKNYIFSADKPDRDYLHQVFNKGLNETKFSASDGNYELYYPYIKDSRKIVLYFSDYQRYGKFGSS